jgi:polysaccharide deacetylase family protein (PEP-CTERM system associated)
MNGNVLRNRNNGVRFSRTRPARAILRTLMENASRAGTFRLAAAARSGESAPRAAARTHPALHVRRPSGSHPRPMAVHHFTVDVEEYFHANALEPYAPRGEWDSFPSRVEPGTHAILDLLAERGVHGTFFVLGWVARRHPALLRRIAAEGHEIASHGWGHRRVTELTPEQFRRSVRDSRAELESLSGCAVAGYRAPSFSIVPRTEWALDVLVEEGYRYDSSIFPGRPGSGWGGEGRDPHRVQRAAGGLDVIPPATLRLAGRTLPAGGGAYFRLLPYRLCAAALRQAAARGAPATFYVHPWEVDPGQPRFAVPRLTRIRHYGGLRNTMPRLRRLLGEFRFQPIARTLSLAEAA